MNEVMEFPDREHFRKWLEANCLSSEGVWLLFGKSGGPLNAEHCSIRLLLCPPDA